MSESAHVRKLSTEYKRWTMDTKLIAVVKIAKQAVVMNAAVGPMR